MEAQEDKDLCPKCDGRGFVREANIIKRYTYGIEHCVCKDVCNVCNGTGYVAIPRPPRKHISVSVAELELAKDKLEEAVNYAHPEYMGVALIRADYVREILDRVIDDIKEASNE